jgi:Lon-like ATP-dependent protease
MQAGVKKVLIPRENWQELYKDMKIIVIPVDDIKEVLDIVFERKSRIIEEITTLTPQVNVLTAMNLPPFKY